jgi:replication factor C small subunit
LYGPPGTGKTTLAKLLVKGIPCDHIYINASDENGIDTIRDKIKSFASSCGFKPLKVIILDEADFLTAPAQASLRPVMEMFAMNTRFILTGNYHERVSEPISSRVQSFELLPPSKRDVAVHLTEILKKENVTYSPEELATIVNAYYPDIRKVIQVAQQSSLSGELKVARTNLVQYDIRNKIVELLKAKSPLSEVRKYVIEQNLNRFEAIYQHLYENVDKFAEGKQGSVILKIADGIKNDTLGPNKQIMFMACMIEILAILKKA